MKDSLGKLLVGVTGLVLQSAFESQRGKAPVIKSYSGLGQGSATFYNGGLTWVGIFHQNIASPFFCHRSFLLMIASVTHHRILPPAAKVPPPLEKPPISKLYGLNEWLACQIQPIGWQWLTPRLGAAMAYCLLVCKRADNFEPAAGQLKI